MGRRLVLYHTGHKQKSILLLYSSRLVTAMLWNLPSGARSYMQDVHITESSGVRRTGRDALSQDYIEVKRRYGAIGTTPALKVMRRGAIPTVPRDSPAPRGI